MKPRILLLIPVFWKVVLFMVFCAGQGLAQADVQKKPDESGKTVTSEHKSGRLQKTSVPEKKIDSKKAELAQFALSQLDAVIDDLKQAENLSNIAPISQQVIEKLSTERPERCRELLLAHFDNFLRQIEESRKERKLENRAFLHQGQMQAIIRLAAVFDSELATTLIERWRRNEAAAAIFGGADASLFLAKELVGSNSSAAISLAESQQGQPVTVRTLEFLSCLRNENEDAAKKYFLSLLSNLESRATLSASELMLLLPYVLPSDIIPVINSAGKLGFTSGYDLGKGITTYQPDPVCISRYLQVSASYLLRSDAYSQGDTGQEKTLTDLTFTGMLLSIAGKYAPSLVNTLFERQNTLRARLVESQQKIAEESFSRFDQKYFSKQTDKSKQSSDTTAEQFIAEADRAADPQKKDQLLFEAASQYVKSGDYEQAINLAGKLSESLREPAREHLLYVCSEAELEAKQPEKAVARIRKNNDLTRRACILTLAANSYVSEAPEQPDKQKATELLLECADLVSKVQANDEKMAILASISATYAKYDPIRSQDYLRDFVEMANKTDKVDERSVVVRLVTVNKFRYGRFLYQDKINLREAVYSLAKKDFYSLISLLKGLKHTEMRVRSVVNASLAVLEQ
jgi:TolA-binding protein